MVAPVVAPFQFDSRVWLDEKMRVVDNPSILAIVDDGQCDAGAALDVQPRSFSISPLEVFTYLSIYLFMYLFIHISFYLFIYLSSDHFLSLSLSLCLLFFY